MQMKTDTSNDHADPRIENEMLEDENEKHDVTEVGDEPPVDESERDDRSEGPVPAAANRTVNWSRVVAYGILPYLALSLAVGTAYLKWQESWTRNATSARVESVAAAKESTIALLSYQPDTVEKELDAARSRLTGTFRESYTSLTDDVVIPGAKQKHISAVATVPAASSVSATPNHAVVLLFVDQRTVIGADEPTDTASSVRVTLDKIAGRWLISSFDPV